MFLLLPFFFRVARH